MGFGDREQLSHRGEESTAQVTDECVGGVNYHGAQAAAVDRAIERPNGRRAAPSRAGRGNGRQVRQAPAVDARQRKARQTGGAKARPHCP